jgi:hypothetical protein
MTEDGKGEIDIGVDVISDGDTQKFLCQSSYGTRYGDVHAVAAVIHCAPQSQHRGAVPGKGK